MNSSMPAGWYHAQGDPVGTNRYWDGAAWVGGPQPVGGPTAGPQGFAPPGYGVQTRADLASWGQRAAALLIDSLCLGAVSTLFVGIAIALISTMADTSASSDSTAAAAILIISIVGLALIGTQIAYLGVYQGRTGTTIGKKALSIRLVKETTNAPPGAGIGVGRYLVAWVLGSVTGVYGLVDYLWPLWDDKSQRLTDKMVGTLVVKS